VAALVALEGVVIGLLGLLVIGLLRSHAEILQRLERLDPGGGATVAVAAGGRGGGAASGVVSEVELRTVPGVPPGRPGPVDKPAVDIKGVRPNGAPVVVGVVGTRTPTLLAFLSSGCTTCAGFWDAFGSGAADQLRGGTRLVAVTKGPDAEQPAAVARLAPRHVPTVMSSGAWADYAVPVSPYFVLVDGPSGRVVGEGAAATWKQMDSLLERVWDDNGWSVTAAGGRVASTSGRRRREARVDEDLRAAGIAPGDASLYPGAPVGDGR
jgi:hypothetical protein